MRKFFCLVCGKSINTSASGPFKCPDCQNKFVANQPKIKGISG